MKKMLNVLARTEARMLHMQKQDRWKEQKQPSFNTSLKRYNFHLKMDSLIEDLVHLMGSLPNEDDGGYEDFI